MRAAIGSRLRRILSAGSLLLILHSPLAGMAADLRTIQRRGHLVVAVKDNLRPLGFRDPQGHLQGFEIDIARRLAQELSERPNQLILKPVQNTDRLMVVIQDVADFTIARVTQTTLRSRVVALSQPYYRDGTVLVTRDPHLKDIGQISHQSVAVLNQASTIRALQEKLPAARLIGVSSYQAAWELLEQGGAVAFAADASVLTGWVQEHPHYRILASYLSIEPLVVVLPRGEQYDALRNRINELLERWHLEGWLRQRAEFWGLPWLKEDS